MGGGWVGGVGVGGSEVKAASQQVLPESEDQITLELVRGSIVVLGHPSIQGKTPARDGSMCGEQDD